MAIHSSLHQGPLTITVRRVRHPAVEGSWTGSLSISWLQSTTITVWTITPPKRRRAAPLSRSLELDPQAVPSTRRKSKLWINGIIFNYRSHQIPSTSNGNGGYGSIIIGNNSQSASKEGLLLFGSNGNPQSLAMQNFTQKRNSMNDAERRRQQQNLVA